MGESFFTANYTNLADGWGECLINTAKEGVFLSAPGVAFSLMNSLDIAYPQIVEFEKEDSNLIVQAAWNRTRDKLTLILLNFNPQERHCHIDLSRIKRHFIRRTGKKIAPESGQSFNTLQKPEEVKVESFTPNEGKKINLKLKGMSLVAIELQAQ